jgi:hypothetical protein
MLRTKFIYYAWEVTPVPLPYGEGICRIIRYLHLRHIVASPKEKQFVRSGRY